MLKQDVTLAFVRLQVKSPMQGANRVCTIFDFIRQSLDIDSQQLERVL